MYEHFRTETGNALEHQRSTVKQTVLHLISAWILDKSTGLVITIKNRRKGRTLTTLKRSKRFKPEDVVEEYLARGKLDNVMVRVGQRNGKFAHGSDQGSVRDVWGFSQIVSSGGGIEEAEVVDMKRDPGRQMLSKLHGEQGRNRCINPERPRSKTLIFN